MKSHQTKLAGLLACGLVLFGAVQAGAFGKPISLTKVVAEEDGARFNTAGSVELSVSFDRGESFQRIGRTFLVRGAGLLFTTVLDYLPETSLVKVEGELRVRRGADPEPYVFVDSPGDVEALFETLLARGGIEINKLPIPVVFRSDLTIAEVASADDRFSILVGALGDTGLAGVLGGEGPFTVFAPTNAAFEALPDGLLASLSVDQIRDILLYHVVVGKELQAAKVLERATIATGEGSLLSVSTNADGAFLNSSKLVVTDILTANGVIHVIDAVLLPDDAPVPTQNIAEVAAGAGIFTTLLQAVTDTGLAGAVTDEANPVTVFAPTDAAFEALPEGLLASLTIDQLRNILLYHVVEGEVDSHTLFGLDEATPILGQPIEVNGELERINDSDFVLLDIPTTTGPIHIIDRVLIPESF
jgi:transforming growth factor-beta-induced protein